MKNLQFWPNFQISSIMTKIWIIFKFDQISKIFNFYQNLKNLQFWANFQKSSIFTKIWKIFNFGKIFKNLQCLPKFEKSSKIINVYQNLKNLQIFKNLQFWPKFEKSSFFAKILKIIYFCKKSHSFGCIKFWKIFKFCQSLKNHQLQQNYEKFSI